MNASPVRGAVLIAVAAVLGFLILRGVTDREQVPLAVNTGVAAPTAVVATTPTPDVGTTVFPTATPVVDLTQARPNSQVVVLVANGTEISGQAGRLTDTLRNQGFNTRQPKNADGRPTSVIYFRPGFELEAHVVSDVLNTTTPIAPMPIPDPIAGEDIDLAPVDVFIWVGADALSTS